MINRYSLPILTVVFAVLVCPVKTHGQETPTVTPSRPESVPISGALQTGSVSTDQTTAPGTGASVNTLTTSVQIQGPFQGSVPTGVATKDPILLPLDEAIRRGLAYNLGVIGATQVEESARALRRVALAELLPDVSGTGTVAVEKVSLATLGLQSAQGIPGFQFARVLGPFNFFEAGAVLSQRIFDLTAIRNYRSTKETAVATSLNVRDSRDLVILAVGGTYLQVVAAAARVDSAAAQVETARAVYEQAVR